MAKAPVYKEKFANPAKSKIDSLWEIAHKIKGKCPDELYADLEAAIADLERDCQATKTITRGLNVVGYGVDKARKTVACDTAISILKEIKAIKAW